ncbi:sodium:solute symporter family transporter [Limnoglobus roseus]|uniref:Sodium:solute symporter n=1 Tax=Limnoglobus roseus TaxID=2598579 RepID=A0A5C1A5T9_9BACT|nr:sodium/solute symporter [Limnoglobus roseus]QEL14539.1 sodium:solute symporter [Limnoglobus roseus]
MPSTRLSTVDLIIVAAYIFAMTLMGAWFTRRQKDLQAYFVGGRNVGWFMVLISIVATETSAVTFLSVPGVGYNPDGGNLTFIQLAFGYIIGRCLVAWLLLPLYMRGELFSAYQVLREKFGPAVQRVASGLFLVTRTIADGLRLFLTALVIQYVGLDVETSILLVGVVTIVYTFLGGMKAVLWTDLIQFVIKIAGAVLAGVFVIVQLDGGWQQYLEVGSAANKFIWLDPVFDVTKAYTFWTGLIGGAVFSMASHGADQLMVQRYLCAKSLGNARLALVLSGFTVAVQFLLFLLVGVGLFVAAKTGTFNPGTATKDEVFGLFIVTKMPVGVVGVLVAAILAAAMSTLSSSLNSSANALVTDFYKPLVPNKSEASYVLLSRVMTVVWGVAQMGVAVFAYRIGSERSVVDRVLAVAGLTTGLILGLFLLGRMKKPVSSSSAIAGLLTGAVVVGLAYLPSFDGPQDWLKANVPAWFPADKKTTSLAFPWYAPLGAGTTVLVALLLSAALKPKPAAR